MRFVIVALAMVLTSSVGAQEVTQPALKSQPIPAVRQEESAPTSQQQANPEQSYSQRILSALESIEPAIRELIAEEDKIERERQEGRDIRDLSAQEEMALWAKRMTWATVASLGLTFIGLVLIGFTLRHTRRAADYAKDMVVQAEETTKAAYLAVTATEEAAGNTETMAKAQARAYVNIVSATVGEIRPDSRTPAAIIVRNSGNTPAYSVRAWYWFEFNEVFTPPADDYVYQYGVIEPKGERQLIEIQLFKWRPDVVDRIQSGVTKLYLFGEITYRDAFNSARSTQFRQLYRRLPVGDGMGFFPTKDGNEAT